MTNIPYEERIKNRSNDWYYNKCIQQYYFIIKAEGANQRYKQEIARLNKIIDELEKYIIDEYYIDDWEEKVLSQEDLINKLKELKEEGKE